MIAGVIVIIVVCGIGLWYGIWRGSKPRALAGRRKLTSADFRIISGPGRLEPEVPGLRKGTTRRLRPGNGLPGATRVVNRNGLCLRTGKTISACTCDQCRGIT